MLIRGITRIDDLFYRDNGELQVDTTYGVYSYSRESVEVTVQYRTLRNVAGDDVFNSSGSKQCSLTCERYLSFVQMWATDHFTM